MIGKLSDRSFNVIWQCGVCNKHHQSDQPITLVSKIMGFMPNAGGAQAQVAITAICQYCCKDLDIKEVPPPTIHVPTPADRRKIEKAI